MKQFVTATVLTVLMILCSLFSQSADKQLDVPIRGVQLTWERIPEVDASAILIFRRAMDHRVNPDLTDVPWDEIGRVPPDARFWRDETAQASVIYEYRITVLNTSGEQSEPLEIKIMVPNENAPSAPKGFRVNGFDPMPPE